MGICQLLCLLGCQYVSVSSFNLTLLHVNDIHVRIEETNKYSSTCKPKDKRKGACYGGVGRLHAAVSDIKDKEDNVLWINAGDFFQGTIWYSHYKWRVASLFNNLLEFDAMTLGNHEFDDKIEGLLPFLKNQTVPVVVSNLDLENVKELQDLVIPSLKVKYDGREIGIVGYLTPETKHISDPGDEIVFLDEIEALKTEIDNLKKSGVNIIIAIGHSGYARDLEIARALPDIDIIVGGHSHSFLYNESKENPNPSSNTIQGPYPTLLSHGEEHSTLVVQAYAFTKYLGYLRLKFDTEGRLEEWSGAPLLLDSSFRQDKQIEDQIKPLRKELDDIVSKTIGSAAKVMPISRGEESPLGNFVTDAMVDAWKNRTMPDNSKVRLALTNSGGIRNTLDEGRITLEDLLSTFPFQNTFDVITVSGEVIREALEHSVATMDISVKWEAGRFLQVSGFRILYDLTSPPGSRVKKVDVICAKCDPETFEELEYETVYNVAVTNYIAAGGDGYEMLKRRDNHIIGSLDTEVLERVIRDTSPISSEIEGRIMFVNKDNEVPRMMSSTSSQPRIPPVPLIMYPILISLLIVFF